MTDRQCAVLSVVSGANAKRCEMMRNVEQSEHLHRRQGAAHHSSATGYTAAKGGEPGTGASASSAGRAFPSRIAGALTARDPKETLAP